MKKKRRGIKNFIVLILLAIFIGLGYYVVTETDVFMIKSAYVQGNLRVSESEINKYLGLETPLHYFEANPYELEDALLLHPLIQKVEIEKVFPNQLNVRVLERRPVAAVYYSERYLLVDEELVVVEVSEESEGFFVISGYQFSNFHIGTKIHDENSYLLQNAVNLVFLIHSTDYETEPKIEMRNKGIYIVFNDSFEAKLGDGDNTEERYNNMVEVYFELVESNNARGTIIANHDGMPTLLPFGE